MLYHGRENIATMNVKVYLQWTEKKKIKFQATYFLQPLNMEDR